MAGPHEQTDILQFRSPNQPNLHVVYWAREPLSEKPSPCVLLINHGIGEHSGRYKKLVGEILQNVSTVDVIVSYDMRCHGRSEGSRGTTRSIEDYVNDLYEHVLPRVSIQYGMDAKLVILGHSLGGAIVAGCTARPDPLIAEGCGSIKGVILSAPCLEAIPCGTINRALAPFAGFLSKIPGVKGLTKPTGFDSNMLCRDKKVVEDYDNDELTYDKVSVGVGTECLSYGNTVIAKVKAEDNIVLNTVPVLALHGTKDEIVSIDGSRKLVAALQEKGNPSVKLVEVEGAYHEVHNEPPDMGSKQFVDSVCEFLTSIFAA